MVDVVDVGRCGHRRPLDHVPVGVRVLGDPGAERIFGRAPGRRGGLVGLLQLPSEARHAEEGPHLSSKAEEESEAIVHPSERVEV